MVGSRNPIKDHKKNTQDHEGYIQVKCPVDYKVNRTFLINPQGGNVGIGTADSNG